MRTRILPREEWARLAGTELETVYPVLPDGAVVVVVEDGDQIVACWALFPIVHVEGVWIDPDYRGNPRVARRLVAGMKDTARAMGARAVATAALTPEVERLAEKIGGAVLPGRHYTVTL
jgi:ribosomal protein S18 acetylase RimI-like enzyme